MNRTGLAVSMAVNTLATGLIVFKILKVFLEVKATSVERISSSLNSTAGGSKLRHIIFILIESGMALFAIQLLRLVLQSLPDTVQTSSTYIAVKIVVGVHEMVNVIIRSVHLYIFCFLITFTWLGYRTNNNFGASLSEIVLRRRRILKGNCRKSPF